ncbi:MAG TPA: universal stress protein [Acidimicrobiia bacterium]|nr:universal stress protein [Acidimicrobiia bacterium]
MPKTVLVPLDGTTDAEHALPFALRLAGRLDAPMVLVTAQLDGDADVRWLEAAVESVHRADVRAEVVRSASVADALRAVGGSCDDPFVCMATHARTAVGQARLRSVAETVVRTVELPAVLVGPDVAPDRDVTGPLLVCLDGSAASEAIVPVAREWAHALAVNAVVVHVFHPLDVETATMPDRVVGAAVEQLRAEVDVETVLVRGRSVDSTIARIVEERQPALVAMATHGRTGLGRVVFGSVATSVVRHSPCPVLVVRPSPELLAGPAPRT